MRSAKNLLCMELGNDVCCTAYLVWQFQCSISYKLIRLRSQWERLHDHCERITELFPVDFNWIYLYAHRLRVKKWKLKVCELPFLELFMQKILQIVSKKKKIKRQHWVILWVCCQSNKIRWATEMNTFRKFGKWQNISSCFNCNW